MPNFKLSSTYAPSGDQGAAIEKLTAEIKAGTTEQVLLGVTGSGKTFTMANVIQNLQRPTLIMAHNKTLAAQLYGEMKAFFPDNAVEYFVSYYDYYQPEAYIPKTDTYIEKDSAINEQIDLLRHSATRSLLERRDVIVVASVSCLYGLGSPELYSQMVVQITKSSEFNRNRLLEELVKLQYHRNDIEFVRGNFRVKGDVVDIFPSHSDSSSIRVEFFGDEIDNISEFDPLTSRKTKQLNEIRIYANSHFVTPIHIIRSMVKDIQNEMAARVAFFEKEGKLLEAQRIRQRTQYDVELLLEMGTCKGIENYSRYLTGRKEGEPPPTLFEYLPQGSLLFVDESHVTLGQIKAMYRGDRARKTNLIDHGFRLVSAFDNRPLQFEEWDALKPDTVYVSATPSKVELEKTGGVIVEQIIRPTGLIDPPCFIRPIKNQVDDLVNECKIVKDAGLRVLVTTLTKKMAENLNEYLLEIGVKSTYIHSDIDTIERIEIIRMLRQGDLDVLVGVNLLREGLDIPECGLVAIMDADKEGFLRSETALVQTIGRAARNVDSRVILYADKITNSIQRAVSETERRRKIQTEYNEKHNITPRTIVKEINTSLIQLLDKDRHIMQPTKKETIKHLGIEELDKLIIKVKKEMLAAANNLEFEKAVQLREELRKLQQQRLVLD